MNCKSWLILLLVLPFKILSGSDWIWLHPVPPGNPLYAVHVVDSSTILVMGEAGIMLRSDDFGQNWSVNYVKGVTENIYGCHFFDSQSGFVVGENGAIYIRIYPKNRARCFKIDDSPCFVIDGLALVNYKLVLA